MSDNLLEQIFNEHIPSAGPIDPVLDLIGKATSVHIETEKYVQVYGESLEHYHLAVGDRELYEMGMTSRINAVAEDVEEYVSETTGQ